MFSNGQGGSRPWQTFAGIGGSLLSSDIMDFGAVGSTSRLVLAGAEGRRVTRSSTQVSRLFAGQVVKRGSRNETAD